MILRLILLFCLLIPWHVSAENVETVNKEVLLTFVQRRAEEIFALASSKESYQKRVTDFHALLDRYVDYRKLSFFLLGPYARTIEKSQWLEYYQILKDYLVHFYLFKITVYSDNVTIKIFPDIDQRGSGFIIKTLMSSSLVKDPFAMAWWVLPNLSNDEFLLFDFAIEGIWIAQEQRVIFTSKLREFNGDFEAFLLWLKRSLDKRIEKEKRRLEK